MILVVPVMNAHELTKEFMDHLRDTVTGEDFRVVVVDNASTVPYSIDEFGDLPFPIHVLRNDVNLGYYYPLRQVYEWEPGNDIYALAHNDLFIYERSWDQRLVASFLNDPKIGIVGFCGSSEVDYRGGRGGGTMCHFRGDRGQKQDAGRRVTGLHAAVTLDSLFMAVRGSLVPWLAINPDITPAHFYDRIWPARASKLGWRTAVLGIEVDHMGGMTLVAQPEYQADMERWCRDHGVETNGNAGLAVYLEAERRYLTEFSDWLPCYIGGDYVIRR